MRRDKATSQLGSLASRPCPGGHPDHEIVRLPNDASATLGLPAGSEIHVYRRREPADGDLVLVEPARFGSREWLVRRYHESGGTVTRRVPDGREPANMRWRSELHVRGVVEPSSESPCGSNTS